ncbi:MAG: hypothetical protein MI741_23365 [Rhodospirillales bacterium]|nr:hypothetical protein [Rhodospirillales bacterium]
MPQETKPSQSPQWYPLEAVAGWVVPGLGHILLGERRRGLILMICIAGLWFSGVLIGGLGVVDWKKPNAPFLWFGQAFVAPTFAANWMINNQRFGPIIPEDPLPPDDISNDASTYRPSFNRVEEQGVLYTAIAGLLNLMALIDVIYRDPRSPRYRKPGEVVPPPSRDKEDERASNRRKGALA